MVVCDASYMLGNITNQLLTLSTVHDTVVIEWLSKLSTLLRTGISGQRGDYLDTRNQLGRLEDKVTNIKGVNKTLAANFHMGKGKRIKDKGFMTVSIEAGESNMEVKLALDLHRVFINRFFKNPSV